VDDTIHFLSRDNDEVRIADTHQEAIQRAFTRVGSALLRTTIVLVTGFLTTIFGDTRDTRVFGIMGPSP
jgi:predicted RND superfamily exporter protein